MAVKLIVFDCDGVLFRSERANVAFYDEVLRMAGAPPLDDWGIAACHALSSAQLFERFYSDRPELLERLRSIAQQLDYGPYYGLMEPAGDLAALLGRLRETYRTAMASNRGKTVHGVLEYFRLSGAFDLALGVLDVERPKPSPDMLLRCLGHFSVSGREAVYVGDQDTDAEAARAAGLRFIAMGATVSDCDRRIFALDELAETVATL